MNTSGQDLVDHCQRIDGQTKPYSSACLQMLKALYDKEWRDADVRGIAIQDAVEALEANHPNLKRTTIQAYKSRFTIAIDSLLEWIDDPDGWTANRPPARRGNLINYPYPLRDDLLISIALPADLKLDEVNRITRFIETLVMDPAAGE